MVRSSRSPAPSDAGTHALRNTGRAPACAFGRGGFISLAASSRSGHGVGIQLARARLALAFPSCERWRKAVAANVAEPRSHRAPAGRAARNAARFLDGPAGERGVDRPSRRARTSGLTGRCRGRQRFRAGSSSHLPGGHPPFRRCLRRRSRRRAWQPADCRTRLSHRSATLSGDGVRVACAASSHRFAVQDERPSPISRLRTLRRFSFASAAAISSRRMGKAFRSMGALGNA